MINLNRAKNFETTLTFTIKKRKKKMQQMRKKQKTFYEMHFDWKTTAFQL